MAASGEALLLLGTAEKNAGSVPSPDLSCSATNASNSACMALATASVSSTVPAAPASLKIRSGMIGQFHAAPAIPTALFVAAAAIPAQKVPWKPTSIPISSKIGPGFGSASWLPKSQPFTSST